MEQLKNLKVGQKYTLVKMGEFGFPYKILFELVEVRVEPYAQYAESVVLIFKEKRKRNLRSIRFLDRDDFLIYDDFVEPTTEIHVNNLPPVNGLTCKVSLSSFDIEYLYRAKRSVEQAPLIEHITDKAIDYSQKCKERKA